ncbi:MULTISPECIES: hypothetical protein [unclassified Thioalkalivibrio]|uniref:hypothetical protein n=1 Tax=unclassified Thioalkalivibrio TaxID=2621013 RepID=UPI00036AB8A4|nr:MULTISPECIES: hypothetical protein [unclassified Thioalkalivibrio]
MMMLKPTFNRVALTATLILTTTACAGNAMDANNDVHGYEYDEHGEPVAAYVFTGWDDRNCAQYRLEALRDDMAAVTAMFVWDGVQFTMDQGRCKPGVTPR